MAPSETNELTDETPATTAENTEEGQEEAAPKLNLEVKIDSTGSCERHITVTIPRDDINRYYDKEFTDLVHSAQVPGFRPGRAPRKLIEHRYRKEIGDRIKTALLMDSLGQITEEQNLAAISEPKFKVESVVLPDDGAMTFEFDLEVRPEFDVPEWKGLKIERPTREISDADVEDQLQRILSERSHTEPFDGAASSGDVVVADVTVTRADNGEQLSFHAEERLQLHPVLSFADGDLNDFDKLLTGVKAGESRTGEMKISEEVEKEELRGLAIKVTFNVKQVLKSIAAAVTPDLLQELGNFEEEQELRDAIRDRLQRRLEYAQNQRTREQVLTSLVASADWELPPDLVRRQANRELERAILELQASGFSERDIMAYENQLRQQTLTRTRQALKEHFVLERIAEAEKIDAEPADYDLEIALIAAQSNQNARRVRAQLEKRNQMDSLRNQIVERKVLSMITDSATFQDVPFDFQQPQRESVEWATAGNEESDIPEALHEDNAPAEKAPGRP